MKMKIVRLLFLSFIFSSACFAQVPTVTVSLSVSPGTAVCDNEPVTFTATISGCPGAYVIYWKDGAFIIDTTFSPSTTWNTMLYAGTRQIWCTVDCNPNGNGNASIITMTVDDCSGIEEYENGSQLTLYPNPSLGDIVINAERLQMFPSSLTVFDIQGRIVKVSYQIKGHVAVFNATQFENGTYYYRIADKKNEKSATGKFVIVK
jgi:hypothetical protein